MTPGHTPVMLPEVLEALSPADGEVYLDGTYGGGGYACAILAAAPCRLIGIDRDITAIERAEREAESEARLVPVLGRFGDLDELATAAGFPAVDGIVLDLGVSSFQIDQAARGFSFLRDGPLDMRMGAVGPRAADVVNGLGERGLADIIYRLGEERQARRIARRIVERRATRPFEATLDLAETIEAALGGRRGAKIHPATKTFQAIRMFINDELGELGRALVAAERLLRAGGRLVIVTFHSLEDRIVKAFLRDRSGQARGGSRHAPELPKGAEPSFQPISRKAVAVSLEEALANPRARSSKLRAAVRTDAPAWGGNGWAGLDLPSLEEVETAE
ncbi:MAG: 16S rRNA (cytosine(1402)-N(4))-methyltransferase RsmH [Pseudomonadota bacterium]